MTASAGPTFGSTLFSFTNEWLATTRPVGDLLERVAEHGLGPDLEVDGFTSFRGLPEPTAAEVDAFRASCDGLGLRPSVFGVYVDRARRADRWLDVDEGVVDLETQLHLADRLGFGVVRGAFGIDLRVVERVLPTLAELAVVLTLEVQGTMTPDSPALVELMEWLGRQDDAPVGLTLDTSVAMPDLPPSDRRHLRALGLTPPVEGLLDEWWRADGPAHDRFARFRDAASAVGAPAALLDRLVTVFVRMGCGRPEDWQALLPWVRHVHAKFWDWESSADQVVAPQGAFLCELADAGYRGSVSSEWGGSEWLGLDEASAFDLVGRHLAALRPLV